MLQPSIVFASMPPVDGVNALISHVHTEQMKSKYMMWLNVCRALFQGTSRWRVFTAPYLQVMTKKGTSRVSLVSVSIPPPPSSKPASTCLSTFPLLLFVFISLFKQDCSHPRPIMPESHSHHQLHSSQKKKKFLTSSTKQRNLLLGPSSDSFTGTHRCAALFQNLCLVVRCGGLAVLGCNGPAVQLSRGERARK